MNVAVGCVIINAQDMLAPGMLAFSSLTGSYYSFDRNSVLGTSSKKKAANIIPLLAA